jgi:hypothetical protein
VTLKITPFLLLLLEDENKEKPKALFVNVTSNGDV